MLIACAAVLIGCTGEPQTPNGANPNGPPATPAPPGKLTLLVVDDPALADAAQREWKARAEGELIVTQATTAELLAMKQFDVDALIVPPALLGELAESGRIEPPPATVLNDPLLAKGDLLGLTWNHECRWGTVPWAIPLGSPQFALVYRADLLAKLNAEPPRTWAEFDALARRLNDRAALGVPEPVEGQSWAGATVPLAGDWAAEMLFARAASSARDPSSYSGLFDIETMKPLIAEPPFVRALQEMSAADELSERNVACTPAEARRRIRTGQTAMAITWPTAAREESVPLKLPAGATLAIAELPGAAQYYSREKRAWLDRVAGQTQATPLLAIAGRIGVVSAESRTRMAAWRMLSQLASAEWSPIVSPPSPHTGPFRLSHLDKPAAWVDVQGDPSAAPDYAALLRERQSRGVSMMTLRIPARARYLHALAQAIDSCREKKPPEDALAAAAADWEKITESLGRDAQRRAYRRSLALE